jgi:hypothetical protein
MERTLASHRNTDPAVDGTVVERRGSTHELMAVPAEARGALAPGAVGAARARTLPSSSAGGQHRRRTRFLVLERPQLLIVLHHVFASLLFAAVVVGALIGPSVAETLSDSASIQSAERLLMLHEVVWPTIAIAVVLLIALSLVTSHRIVGPLYRFRRVLDGVGEGRIASEVKFRGGDLLRVEFEALNGMLRGLRDRIEGVRGCEHALSLTLASIAESSRAGESVGPERVAMLESRVQELACELRRFDLEPAGGRTRPEPSGP